MNLVAPYGHPAWIEIDLQQFKQNITHLRAYLGKTKLCLPVKANAYGHGLIPIARAAVQAGVDYLAVSSLQEGAALRRAKIQIPILVMGAIHELQIPELIAYDLEFSISSRYKAELVAAVHQPNLAKCRVHLEIDTGMQRTGVRPASARDLFDYLLNTPCFEVVGVYSHLASASFADNANTLKQITEFEQFVTAHVSGRAPTVICHLANSGGTCHYPAALFDMVRPGLIAFGYGAEHVKSILAHLKPCFTLKAKIAYFKVVAAQAGISYEHTYITQQTTRIITIPVGYGDGYRRALSNTATVLHRGQPYPVVGSICMDQFMVDIEQQEAFIGEEVVLIGQQGLNEIKLTHIAALCNTITYEILCGFNNRLPRYYRDDEHNYWDVET